MLAKECGISLNRYLTETGLKHHPRQRHTKEEVDASTPVNQTSDIGFVKEERSGSLWDDDWSE